VCVCVCVCDTCNDGWLLFHHHYNYGNVLVVVVLVLLLFGGAYDANNRVYILAIELYPRSSPPRSKLPSIQIPS
jgi:hypothetical protein